LKTCQKWNVVTKKEFDTKRERFHKRGKSEGAGFLPSSRETGTTGNNGGGKGQPGDVSDGEFGRLARKKSNLWLIKNR